jgi:hypothetical protein
MRSTTPVKETAGRAEELLDGAGSGLDTSGLEHHQILMLHKVTDFGWVGELK